MSTKRSRNRDRHGRAQALAPAVLPVVTPLCIGAFLAFTQRPRVVVAPPPPVEADSVSASASPGVVKDSAIDCNPDAGAKACKTCGVVKPLTEFFKSGTRNTRREACCKACSTEAVTATPDAPRRASTVTATSTATVTGKTCKTCGVVKPLALFNRSGRTDDRLTVNCTACIEAVRRRAELASKAVESSRASAGLDARTRAVKVTASPQLINVARLGYEARQAKTGRAYYEHGRVKIEALYDKRAGTTEYRVGGWPCPVDYLTNVFDEIHSGRPLGWL